MEKGHCAATPTSPSARRAGPTLGTKTELKNLNSFRFVEQAHRRTRSRARPQPRAGERIVQETRLWDADARSTRPMRTKEQAHDYRYFPEPDLPPLVVDAG